MKFDPFAWHEFKPNAETVFESGRVRVKASADVAWYIICQGVETLAGVGTELDATLAHPGTVRAETSLKSVRCFIYEPMPTTFTPSGPKFTNADRKPMESGAVLEVKKAVREMELRQREYRREQAALMAQQREIAASTRPQEVTPEAETAPAAVEPEGETDET